MGQVVSYIWSQWRCMRPTRTSLQDDQLNQFEQQCHYITIPDGDTTTTPVPCSNRDNVASTQTYSFIPAEVPKLNQFEQQSHYITIPDGDTTTPVPCSNRDVVASTQTYSFIPAEVSSIVVDLSDADQKNDKEEQKAEGVEVIHAVVQKEVITEVLAAPCKLSGVSREIIKRIGPYNSMQRILLVGEGDFSFSASLAVAFGSASNMIATSLNSQEFLTKNYRKFVANKMKLEIRGCVVIHGVDATNMVTHSVLGSLRFDCIIFNFPHAGNFGRSNSDMCKNRNLVRGFLTNAKNMVNEDGEIHITHKSNRFFGQWDIPKIGSDQGLHLIQEIRFKRSMYPGYHTMFGFGGDRFFHCNPSKTYKFRKHPK